MAGSTGLVSICIVALLAGMASATQFRVGGSKGWSVPDPDAMSYNHWAEKNRFHIGDSLLFDYPPGKDSVLLVDKDAYDTCNTSTSIAKYADGHTVFTFNRSGLFYFISGVESNCLKNESIVILVMADRGSRNPPTPSPSPAQEASPPPSSPPSLPPPSPIEVTPAAEPAPAGEEPSPSPPPPPPPPHGNGVSNSRVAGFMGLVGPILGLFVL